jgi:hypothetical protein
MQEQTQKQNHTYNYTYSDSFFILFIDFTSAACKPVLPTLPAPHKRLNGPDLNDAKNMKILASLAYRKWQAPKDRLYAVLLEIANFNTEKL